MVKLVYTPVLGTGGAIREGSSPFPGTIYKKVKFFRFPSILMVGNAYSFQKLPKKC